MAGHYDDVLQAIENSALILRGYSKALIAAKSAGRKGYFCVVYRELNKDDGFVISAFFALEVNKRHTVWPSKR